MPRMHYGQPPPQSQDATPEIQALYQVLSDELQLCYQAITRLDTTLKHHLATCASASHPPPSAWSGPWMAPTLDTLRERHAQAVHTLTAERNQA